MVVPAWADACTILGECRAAWWTDVSDPVVWYGVRTLPTGTCIACVAADLVVSRTSGIS